MSNGVVLLYELIQAHTTSYATVAQKSPVFQEILESLCLRSHGCMYPCVLERKLLLS